MLDPGLRQQMMRQISDNSTPIEPTVPDYPDSPTVLDDIRCLALDVYGTLLCSSAGDIGTTAGGERRKAAFTSVVSAFALSMTPIELERRFHEAIADSHRAGTAMGVDVPEVDILQIWNSVLSDDGATRDQAFLAHLALHYELAANPVWPMPGLVAVLDELRSAEIAVAIVSNAQFYTPLTLEALTGRRLTDWGIHPQIWSFEQGRAKPSPLLFSELVRQSGVSPRNTAYLGNDMLNDVYAAAQAGCRTILFAGDSRSLRLRESDPRCATLRPDAVIRRLSQLPELLVGKHERTQSCEK